MKPAKDRSNVGRTSAVLPTQFESRSQTRRLLPESARPWGLSNMAARVAASSLMIAITSKSWGARSHCQNQNEAARLPSSLRVRPQTSLGRQPREYRSVKSTPMYGGTVPWNVERMGFPNLPVPQPRLARDRELSSAADMVDVAAILFEVLPCVKE